jgi:hypothetical protein
MEPLIRLPKLHPAQQRVVDESKRYNVVVCGRRWGKTRLGIDRAVFAVLSGIPVGWFAPTYKYLMQPWRELSRMLMPIALRTSEAEHSIEIMGGGILDCWSLDNPNSGRGRSYGLIVVDEAAMVLGLKEIWEATLRPTLTDLEGGAWFFSTPKGFDDFNRLYEFGQDPDKPDFASWQMPSITNPRLAPEEIAAARAEMDPRYFAQEYAASFEEMLGRVAFQFDRTQNVKSCADLGGEVLVGMDFNVSPMSAVIGNRAGDELHIFDEIELQNSNTQEMAKALRARYPTRAIAIYPDPSGNARKTSAPVGQTDFAILRAHGFTIRAPAAAPPVVDRTNEVNALCCAADARRRLFIDPKCRATIRSLMQLVYKDGKSVIDKTSGLDHFFDALGYLVHVEFPLAGRRGGGDAADLYGVY